MDTACGSKSQIQRTVTTDYTDSTDILKQFFRIRVIRGIRGSAVFFAIWLLRFAWDLGIGIWKFPVRK